MDMVDMADAVITEYAGTRQGAVARFYQYGREGVRVLDSGKNLQRLYLFDPALDMMTERDPSHQDTIVRRFVFDTYGMLEETFSLGQSPRTFRYEDGCRQIAVREGGRYGAVGKIFSFDREGIAETAWGRHGEIERVYIFEAADDAITERNGSWFGTVDRTLVFEGINASVFREPEAFLQFLMFTERRKGEIQGSEKTGIDNVIRGDGHKMAPGRFAFTGKRRESPDTSPGITEDIRIDVIPDRDASSEKTPDDPSRKKSSEISYAERKAGKKP
jgi:hypothetical protein